MQYQIVVSDGIGVQQTISRACSYQLWKGCSHKLPIDGSVDDNMRYVYTFGPQFARHTLAECTQRMLGAGKGRVAVA